MIAWALVGGCGGPGVPEGTSLVTVGPEGVSLAGGGEITTRVLESDPTQDAEPALVEVLRSVNGHPVVADVPADLPFWKLRRVLGSAGAAGASSRGFRVAGTSDIVPVDSPDKYRIGFRCKEPLAVTQVEPLLTLSVQSGPDGAWVVATATFLPVGPDGPVDGYPPECLVVPPCDTLFPEGAERAACEAGAGRRRVDLGGQWGCLLPIAKSPEQVSEWRRLLPGLVERLGLRDHELRVVMPEARVRADAVAAVLQGLSDGGLPTPVGTESLVEGNDGAPVCMAEVRDRETMKVAAAAWLGSLRAPPPEGEGGGGGGIE